MSSSWQLQQGTRHMSWCEHAHKKRMKLLYFVLLMDFQAKILLKYHTNCYSFDAQSNHTDVFIDSFLTSFSKKRNPLLHEIIFIFSFTILCKAKTSWHNIIQSSMEDGVRLRISKILFGNYTIVILLTTFLYEIQPNKLKWNTVIACY